MLKIASALIGLLLFASAAQADVFICNKTGYRMTFAVAGMVTNPYRTLESSGWWNVNAGACQQVFYGDYTGQKVFYYAYRGRIGNDWQENRDNCPICVPGDVSKFTRRGNAATLQTCPGGWVSKPFYDSLVTARTFTINLYGR